jgi:hypothetical protein
MNNIGKLVIGAFLMSGCATNAYVDSDPELTCRDRQINVIHAPAFLVAHPEYLVVCAGQRVVINVVPAVPPGAATTAPAEKNPGPSDWLRSENREGDTTIIQVPDDAIPGDYKYSITIAGVGTLDPRFGVRR